MKLLFSIILLMFMLTGCTAEQRKNCTVCRLVDGLWQCQSTTQPTTQPVLDSNSIGFQD